MSQFKKIMGLMIVLLAFMACKTKTIPTDKDQKPLPERYTNQSDTVNSGSLQWQLFYKDDNLKKLIETALSNNFDLLAAVQKI